ncbi:hypothetical protein Tco_0639955 [Tanacetum coccineum]
MTDINALYGESVNSESVEEESVVACLSGLKGLHYLLDKVVPARTTPGPNNINHNNNNPNKWRWDAENEDISGINIPIMKFNKWEELAEELMR